MTTIAQIRRQLEAARAAIPEPPVDDGLFHGTSEQAFAEVQRLLAEVEAADPTTPSRELTAEELAFCERAEALAAEGDVQP
jgi:hypothetical protein